MDRQDMFKEEEECGSGNQTVGEMPWEEYSLQGSTPSILTVQYNAWHYRNDIEAWAGLAVEITKELEATMTVAHKLRTSWIYNWRNRKNNICFEMILPFFLALMVAIWFSTIVWFILDTRKHKDIKKLKYGGLPATLIVAAWGLGKSVISFVKPISSQVVDYICLPDHSQKLGYHQKVIDDINFLKESLYYKHSLKWEVFAFVWSCITWSWDENYVPGTKIHKMPPACGNKLRMIVFVDDLDRREENVILQVLSAVNLVLATCKINVILSMENSMIERAILRKYGNNNSKDNKELAEKYLRKIVQLPLHLPDPSDSESSDFLKRQLGMWEIIEGSSNSKAAHGHDKVNPKFKIVTAAPQRFNIGGEGRKQYFEESIAKLKRELARSDTHTAQQGLGQTEEQETIEKAEDAGVEAAATESEQTQEGLGVEEAKIEIDEQSIRTDEDGAGDRQQLESRKCKRGLMDDLSSIISAMLIPKYTPKERSAFRFLHTLCTRSRKLPRELKCLLAYHRLAWNILYLTFHQEDVIPVEGWQVQLIAWVFVCWEWRDLITILIQKWNKLDVLRNWKGEEGPSLREIVQHYIDDELTADKKSTTKKEDDANEEVEKTSGNLPENVMKTISEIQLDSSVSNYLEEENIITNSSDTKDMREMLKKVMEDREMRDMLKKLMKEVFKEEEDNKVERSLQQGKRLKENQTIIKRVMMEEEDKEGESSVQLYTMAEENRKTEKSKEEDEREEWNKLRDSLKRYNVSMDGIQAFQKFRFYCQPGHLPWPLLEQAKFSH